MKREIFFLLVVGLGGFCAGCAGLRASFDSSPVSVNESKNFLQTQRVINPEPLREGGTLLVLPFRPGVDVLADEEYDKIALMMVRGFVDVYQDPQNPFGATSIDVVFSEKTYDADFFLEGVIEKIRKPSFFRRWFAFDRKIIFKVSGKVKDARGRTLLLFADERGVPLKNTDARQLGRLIGQDIARFILTAEQDGIDK